MQNIDSIYVVPSDSLEQQLDEAYRELAMVEEAMAKTLELDDPISKDYFPEDVYAPTYISKDYFSEDVYASTYNEIKKHLDSIQNNIAALEQAIALRDAEYEEDHTM